MFDTENQESSFQRLKNYTFKSDSKFDYALLVKYLFRHHSRESLALKINPELK